MSDISYVQIINSVQFAGLVQKSVRQSIEQGKVASENFDEMFEEKIEEERNIAQDSAGTEESHTEGYDLKKPVQWKREEYLGQKIDILV